jgi:hypothetical protein
MTPTVPTNITTATTTTVKSGSGVLRGIAVNTTAAGTITVYDNTAASGTKIGIIAASVTPGLYLNLPARFAVGCTIVTGAASDLTVYYE